MKTLGRATVALLLLGGCQGLGIWSGTGSDPGSGHGPGPGGTGPGTTTGQPLDPSRVVLHRLNRTEYDDTVRDLLGTSQTPAEDFPPDDLVGGFDDIASNLTVSPLHVELYELAAESLAAEVLALPITETLDDHVEAEGTGVTATVGQVVGSAWNLWSAGDLSTVVDAPADGTYTISVRVWADQAGPDLAQLSLGHDGLSDLVEDVTAAGSAQAEVHEVQVQLTKGVHTVTASFLNDFYDPLTGLDRNLYVDWLDTSGPTGGPTGGNPLRDRWVTCDPAAIGDDACLDEVLRGFLPKAWRRPVTEDEVVAVEAMADGILADGGTFEDALYWSFVEALTSSSFLYRVELDPDPTSAVPHPLADYEIASRLSYFLWSSMPDDELFAAAAAGELQDPDEVAAQVRRMLLDDRAEALVDDFGGQWLYLRGITSATKDSVTYPEFDATLTASMEEEMTRFFRSFVFGDRDLHELLLATDGEIDPVMASLYGIPVTGNSWSTVDLSAYDRGGILGQAGLLTVTAYPARTSPTNRGKFVLGQLLCSEPPPPPPGIPALDETASAETVRDELEQHRADPVCASCHATMDQYGFALEHYDAIGAWRDEDRGFPIDDSAELPDGTTFAGRQGLAETVAADPRFTSCVAEKLMTYALGRLAEPTDQPYLEQITAQAASAGFTFEALAVAVATNDTFRFRRGEP